MTTLRKESRLAALLVAGAFFMQSLDGSIMNTSLPPMAHSFGVAPLELSFGITAYLLTTAALVPLSGWLADRFGARRIFVIAVALFSAASLMCGLSENLWQFGIARVLQGIGGALMLPVGRAIVLRNTEKNQLLDAMALITWPGLAAPIIGPTLGGFITTYISWRWNFLLNVPLGLIGILLTLRHIPDIPGENPRMFDWSGFVLASSALVAVLYGLESLAHAQTHWTMYQWLLPCVLIIGGMGFGWLSVRHLNRVASPLLELSSLSVQTFRAATVTSGLAFRLSISATPYLLPLLFQVGFGLSPLQSGTLLMVYFIGNLGVKPATSPILRRFGFRKVLITNGVLSSLTIMACALFTPQTPSWLIMGTLLFAGATRSMQMTSLNTIAFADITAAQRSASTTILSMFGQIASVLGVAISTLVLSLAVLTETYAEAGLREVRYGFIVVGLIGLIGSLRNVRLPANAGAEVIADAR